MTEQLRFEQALGIAIEVSQTGDGLRRLMVPAADVDAITINALAVGAWRIRLPNHSTPTSAPTSAPLPSSPSLPLSMPSPVKPERPISEAEKLLPLIQPGQSLADYCVALDETRSDASNEAQSESPPDFCAADFVEQLEIRAERLGLRQASLLAFCRTPNLSGESTHICQRLGQ